MFIGRTMLKLKLQYLGHLMWRADSFEKTLMLGKIEGRRGRGKKSMRWPDGITDSIRHEFGWTLGVGDGQWGLACCDSRGRKESDTTEQLNWTDDQQFQEYLLPQFFFLMSCSLIYFLRNHFASFSFVLIFGSPWNIQRFFETISCWYSTSLT